MYCVLDIEATNGQVGDERIIEIALYQYNGHEVTDQLISLVNPNEKIGRVVQNLTGITDKMVRNAPKFHELAKRILEITNQCILVGHNVPFDFRMLQQEFHRLGYDDFNPQQIDTLTISQQLMPEEDSHSLGKLCKSLGINISKRHRASGDALATLKLFELLRTKDSYKQILTDTQKKKENKTGLNQQIRRLLNDVPTKTGVFYLVDKDKQIIYIDCALNLRQAIRRTLQSTPKKLAKVQAYTQTIDFEITGSPLIAQIKKTQEIKHYLPALSKPNKFGKPLTLFGVYYHANQQAVSWQVMPFHGSYQNLLFLFKSKNRAQQFLEKWLKNNHISNDPKDEASQKTLHSVHHNQPNYLVIDAGNGNSKNSFVYVKNYLLCAYGFFDFNYQITTKATRDKRCQPIKSSQETQFLLYDYLRRKPNLKKIIL